MADEATTPEPATDEQMTAEITAAIENEAAGQPITAEAVAGEKAEAPTAPDSTALRDQLQALAAPAPAPQADSREEELTQLRNAVTQLSQIQHQQRTGLTPEQLLERANSPETLARKAMDEARKAREETQEYQAKYTELEQERKLTELRSGVTTFVKSKGDEYLVVNHFDNQDLVLEQMHASLEAGNPMSESEAASYVDDKLRDFIVKGAALLGYVKGDESKAVTSGDAETPTLSPQTVGTAPTKAYDDMTDDEKDKEFASMLRQGLG